MQHNLCNKDIKQNSLNTTRYKVSLRIVPLCVTVWSCWYIFYLKEALGHYPKCYHINFCFCMTPISCTLNVLIHGLIDSFMGHILCHLILQYYRQVLPNYIICNILFLQDIIKCTHLHMILTMLIFRDRTDTHESIFLASHVIAIPLSAHICILPFSFSPSLLPTQTLSAPPSTLHYPGSHTFFSPSLSLSVLPTRCMCVSLCMYLRAHTKWISEMCGHR